MLLQAQNHYCPLFQFRCLFQKRHSESAAAAVELLFPLVPFPVPEELPQADRVPDKTRTAISTAIVL